MAQRAIEPIDADTRPWDMEPGCVAETVWMISLLKSLRSRIVRFLGPPVQLRDEQGSGSLGLAQFSALTRP
jgi:hypothetical protein